MRANEFLNEQWRVTITHRKINTQSVPSTDKKEAAAAIMCGDYMTALKKWRPLAAQGDHEAQYWLGVMYKDGVVVTKNYDKAVKWFALAAKQKDAFAMFNLGSMYAIGQGVPQDFKKAVKWFTFAEEQGMPRAQFIMGLLYTDVMVPENCDTAIKCHELNAE